MLSRSAGALAMAVATAAVAVAATIASVAFPDAARLLAALKGTHFERLGLVEAAPACQYCASFGGG